MSSDPGRPRRIYTKHGDDGTTGLLYGGRVSKTDARVEAYGTVDEAVSALGLARALCDDARTRTTVEALQRQLFVVAAELSTALGFHEDLMRNFGIVTPEMTQELEQAIDEFEADMQLPRAFVVPGDSRASGALDVARATLRRAERRVTALQEQGQLPNDEILRFLNRASDLLFILARYQDRDGTYNRA